jgi:hypothetical protein
MRITIEVAIATEELRTPLPSTDLPQCDGRIQLLTLSVFSRLPGQSFRQEFREEIVVVRFQLPQVWFRVRLGV